MDIIDRTCDSLPEELLTGENHASINEVKVSHWWAWLESDQQSLACHASVLPLNYTPIIGYNNLRLTCLH